MTTVGSALCLYAGTFIPMAWTWAPLWLMYIGVTGTVASGFWHIAHECGHGAFSDNRRLETFVGYVCSTLTLVPYFAWRRSHALHHEFTAHMSLGETAVPAAVNSNPEMFTHGGRELAMRDWFFKRGWLGRQLLAMRRLNFHWWCGWLLYAFAGFTGGPVRGRTSHFFPQQGAKGRHALHPGKHAKRVWQGNCGIVAMLVGLVTWGARAGWQAPLLLYIAPIFVAINWFIMYAWMNHTEVDVPHYDKEDWTWVKGVFSTVDRPLNPVINLLHYNLGRYHVMHHVDHRVPFYHGAEATAAIAKAFPDLYLYDPTPLVPMLWRLAMRCVAVEKQQGTRGAWVYSARSQYE